LAAFALFRLLDITKPGPIGALDRVPGRLGVMGDDVAAGFAAAAVLWLLQWAVGA
jgi:phosphatidylglycerophosphatase A